MVDLAQQIVRDGEGASKFVTVRIEGAASDASAKVIALAIANSPLVKTAIAGEDANWGRVVMAVGKSGEPANRERIAIRIGGYAVAQAGSRVAGYDEGPIAAPHEEPGGGARRRCRCRRRQRYGLDLRSHPRLHLDQRRLPVVTNRVHHRGTETQTGHFSLPPFSSFPRMRESNRTTFVDSRFRGNDRIGGGEKHSLCVSVPLW